MDPQTTNEDELSDLSINEEMDILLSIDTDLLVGMGKANEVRFQSSNKKMHQRTLSPA